jgi:hypothetical protein
MLLRVLTLLSVHIISLFFFVVWNVPFVSYMEGFRVFIPCSLFCGIFPLAEDPTLAC